MTLKEVAIANRATVFEENPFLFNRKHSVSAGSPPPPGYRAVWKDRASLAKAKLYHKLKQGTDPTDFAGILADQATDAASEDFIEVHIYGSISAGTVGAVTVLAPKGAARHQLRSVRRRCKELGIELQEL